ncbi:hypothetical protein M1L65_05475 [Slackia exigua]|uniref:hypothetical protein n=1 Tax=Slackia exigua TaxID=84109 RepID=UPI003B9E7ADF
MDRSTDMALGFKLKTVRTSQGFANEKELFDRIKDEAFTAGKPELVKNGFADVKEQHRYIDCGQRQIQGCRRHRRGFVCELRAYRDFRFHGCRNGQAYGRGHRLGRHRYPHARCV